MTRYAGRNFAKEKHGKFKSRNQWEDINTVFVLPTKPQWIKAGELIFSSSLCPPQCRHLFLNWWDVGCTPTIKSITPAIYLTHSWSEIADLNHFQVSVKGEICTSARRRPETRPYYIIKKLFFFVAFFYQISSGCLFCDIFLTPRSLMAFSAGIQARINAFSFIPLTSVGRFTAQPGRPTAASSISLKHHFPRMTWPCCDITQNADLCETISFLSLFFFLLFLIVAKLLRCCCEQQLRDFWNELPDAHTCTAQPLEVWNWPQVTPIPSPAPSPISKWSIHRTALLRSSTLETSAREVRKPGEVVRSKCYFVPPFFRRNDTELSRN